MMKMKTIKKAGAQKNTSNDEIKRAGTLTNFKKTDHKVGWQSMPLFSLQISFLLFLSFICSIVKSLCLLLLNS